MPLVGLKACTGCRGRGGGQVDAGHAVDSARGLNCPDDHRPQRPRGRRPPPAWTWPRRPRPTQRCGGSSTACPAWTRSAPRRGPRCSAPARSRPPPRRRRIDLAIRMVDLTTLEGQDTPGKVRALCTKAMRPDPPTRPARPPPRSASTPTWSRVAKETLGAQRGPRRRRGDRVPVRPRGAGHQARRHPRRGRGRRRRDRHGDRPGRVPVRPLPAGVRRDRRGARGVRASRREHAPTSR